MPYSVNDINNIYRLQNPIQGHKTSIAALRERRFAHSMALLLRMRALFSKQDATKRFQAGWLCSACHGLTGDVRAG
jgi:hypothetical protein